MASQNVEIIQKRDDKVTFRIQSPNAETWEKDYPQETKLNIVLEEYKNGTGNDFPLEILETWQNKRNEEEVKDQEIKNFINKYEEGYIALGSNALKIPEIIGKPFNDPFCIFAFKKREKILKVLNFEGKDIKGLENYGPYSAYCNGNDALFISGGEINNKKYVEKFWKIDLNSSTIECINMIPKKNHSMIVLPGNYVFIVGGQDKETFYYDSENPNGFYGWKPLNEIRIEPALILVNNFLYCFDNINLNKLNNDITFEKTDFNSNLPKWELINVNIPDIKFDQKFFGVVQKDNDILFLGGNIDTQEEDKNGAIERKNFKYNITENKLEESEIPFMEFNLKEKTFLTYNEYVNYIFPDFNKYHPEVIFYQKSKNKIRLVKYESLAEQKKINDLPAAKINHIIFDQPKVDQKMDNEESIKNDDNINKDSNFNINNIKDNIINTEKNENNNKFETEDQHQGTEVVSGNGGKKSEVIIDEKEEKKVTIPEEPNPKKSLENNDDNNNTELNNSNPNPIMSIKEDIQKKSSIKLDPEIRESENEEINSKNLELLKDILKSSQIEENKKIETPEIEEKKEIEIPENVEKKENPNHEIEEKKDTVIITVSGNEENDKPKPGDGINDIINYKFSNNNNISNKYDGINLSQIGKSMEQPNKENEINNKEGEPNNSLKNTEIKIDEPKIEQPTINISKPELKIQVENSKGKQKEGFNYYDSGIIIGTKNLKEKDSNEKKDIKEIKEPKIELEGKGNVNIPNPEIKGGNIEENINQPNPNVDIKLESNQKQGKDFCITGVIVGTKEKDPKILKFNEEDKSKINQKVDKVDINVENPSVKKTLNFDTNLNLYAIKPEIDNAQDLKSPRIINEEEKKIEGNNFTNAPPNDINLDNKININGNINYPNLEVDNDPKGVSIPNPNIELNSGKVDIKGNIPDNINENDQKIGVKYNSNIPEMNITGTDAKTKTPMKLPGSINQNDVKPFDINIQKPSVEINPKEDNKENIDQNFKLSGIILGTKDPKYNKKNDKPSENKSDLNIKGPQLDFNGNIIKSSNEPKLEIKSSKENEINLNIKNNEPNNKEGESNQFFKMSGIILADKGKTKESENGLKGKKIVLPTVTVKNENFVSSKVDEGGNLNEINVNMDNLKSANVGINGQKLGERVDNN